MTGLLGRGGMGEVYRADDLKLDQPVALKFLPEAVEHDPHRLARFLNEVRVALRVSHPNVCRVHDIGEVDGQPYISMEYIDGEARLTAPGSQRLAPAIGVLGIPPALRSMTSSTSFVLDPLRSGLPRFPDGYKFPAPFHLSTHFYNE